VKDITMAMIEAGRKFSDGHFTLMAFTTHWKATFRTPITDGGYPNEIQQLTPCSTPDEAVKVAFCDLLKREFEKKVKRDFDPTLSKKLDCIMFILEN
jgi:hypothetical protein